MITLNLLRSRLAATAGITGLAALLAMALPGPVAAQSQLSFPGDAPDSDLIRIQRKAELAYQNGDYDRAFWYYRKELAPVGDKYAQYMVGYMTYHGEGVPSDPVEAAAWFSLAAERGHEPIVEVVDSYRAALSPAQLAAAREESEALKSEIGDVALVKALIRRDMQRLRETTGSRVNSQNCNQPARVYITGEIGSRSMEGFCTMLNARIEKRLAYITGYVEYGELELLPDENDAAASQEKRDP